MTKEQVKQEIDSLSEEQRQKVTALIEEIMQEAQEKNLQNFIHTVDQHPIKANVASLTVSR